VKNCLLTPLPIDSIAYAYMTMTAALGFIPLRHEGKLTGLAAYGHPILADKIAARFFVDENGRITSNFRDYPDMVKFIHGLDKGVNREDASASIQQVLESTMLCSIGQLLERTKARHLGAAGGVFANVRLNRLLAEQLLY
jgi:carbamoyltransferase